MVIPAGIAEVEEEMIALRRRIHAHPELAYEEFMGALKGGKKSQTTLSNARRFWRSSASRQSRRLLDTARRSVSRRWRSSIHRTQGLDYAG